MCHADSVVRREGAHDLPDCFVGPLLALLRITGFVHFAFARAAPDQLLTLSVPGIDDQGALLEGEGVGGPGADTTIKRLQAYEAAGADVLFAPGVRSLATTLGLQLEPVPMDARGILPDALVNYIARLGWNLLEQAAPPPELEGFAIAELAATG